MNKNPKAISIILSSLLLCLAVAFYISAWTEPTEAPPEGNVPAPLNIGPKIQRKEGPLIINYGTSAGRAPVGLYVGGKVGINAIREDWSFIIPEAELDVNGDVKVRNLGNCGKVYTENGVLKCGDDEVATCVTGQFECPEGQVVKGFDISEGEVNLICEPLH